MQQNNIDAIDSLLTGVTAFCGFTGLDDGNIGLIHESLAAEWAEINAVLKIDNAPPAERITRIAQAFTAGALGAYEIASKNNMQCSKIDPATGYMRGASFATRFFMSFCDFSPNLDDIKDALAEEYLQHDGQWDHAQAVAYGLRDGMVFAWKSWRVTRALHLQ